MVDILFTYDKPVPGSYGEVYLRAAKELEKKELLLFVLIGQNF
ncbi:MAG: hypothetical protein AABX04_03855 [Nanoarchaeota archaeon]